ncbi:MAG TPA: hypothetical protein VEB43_14860 [Anaeromyxobacter sp.]|nr:hypothetical protein [Anaeromyxobacter sp.]
MLTLKDLDALERCAEAGAPGDSSAQDADRTATFERMAAPYRRLLRSARELVAAGRSIGPELEEELRLGCRALSGLRRKLGFAGVGR